MSHKWSSDDDLLVIALYQRHGALTPDRSEVRSVARVIGTTPESVAAALANVRFLDTGVGLDRVSSHMKQMWERWGASPDEAAAAAAEARRRIEAARQDQPSPELTEEQKARIAARRAERRRDL